MPNPWDRPSTGSPFRTGEYDANRLYLAVGHCLSKWERLEGAMTHLYAVIVGADDYYLGAPVIRAFGTLNSPAARADMIATAANAVFYYIGFDAGIEPVQAEIDEAKAIEDELREVLKHYRGWMARRNDVAHGYVSTSEHPDPTREGEPMATSSLLFPSDGSSAKWCLIVGEPAYAYEASHIDSFGGAFEDLEKRVNVLSERLSKYRQAAFAKLPNAN